MKLLQETQIHKVQTQWGDLEITAVAMDQVYVRFTNLTIRNQRCYGHVRLINYVLDQGWGLRRLDAVRAAEGANVESAIWLKNITHRDADELCRRHFLLSVVPFVTSWLDQHPEVLREAEQINLHNKIINQQQRIQDIEKQLEKAKEELNQLLEAEKKLK